MTQAEGRRVLVVDDDRDVLRGIGLRLRAAGYDVPTAQDGAAGLASAFSQRPDAIVLDLRMPVMDGFTMLRHLKDNQSTREVPVVVLSANAVERSRSRAFDLGAKFFLEKPYEVKNLLNAVEAAITSSKNTGPVS